MRKNLEVQILKNQRERIEIIEERRCWNEKLNNSQIQRLETLKEKDKKI